MMIPDKLMKWLGTRDRKPVPPAPAPDGFERRKALFRACGIDRVLDVGANKGQYALRLRRKMGFTGRILSFEPVSATFQKLQKRAQEDPAWEVFPFALGESCGTATIHVAGNSVSSSLLPMLDTHLEAAPESRTVCDETIEIRTLDSLIETACPAGARICLKMDAQGMEDKILRGAEQTLARVDLIQTELSLVPLYEGSVLIEEMFRLLRQKGFVPVSLEPGFTDPATGHLLQADGLFRRNGPVAPTRDGPC